MAKIQDVTLKLLGMRKAQDFVVYPAAAESNERQIQSATRIGRVYKDRKVCLLSPPRSSGAYGVHLAFGKEVPISDEDIAKIFDATPKSGDQIGPGVYVA